MTNNKEQATGPNYLEFFMKEINPKYEEIVVADSYKKRRKIQKEIVAKIREAGFINEANRQKLFFNL